MFIRIAPQTAQAWQAPRIAQIPHGVGNLVPYERIRIVGESNQSGSGPTVADVSESCYP